MLVIWLSVTESLGTVSKRNELLSMSFDVGHDAGRAIAVQASGFALPAALRGSLLLGLLLI